MSFRKRSEVIQRGVGSTRTASAVPGRNGGVSTGLPNRGVTTAMRTVRGMNVERSPHNTTTSTPPPVADPFATHPGVRPSPVSSNRCTSTGCIDLDKLLTHQGIPLGESLLVEERSTTEFQSTIFKSFIAQGIQYDRKVKGQDNTHTVVITMNTHLGQELPGVYKGSRREQKKTQIKEETNKLSVQNLNETSGRHVPTRYKDLKIAWKYGYADEVKANTAMDASQDDYKDYQNQFDITTRLVPPPRPTEWTVIPIKSSVSTIVQELETIITKKHPNKLVRIVIPNFLHPAMYPPPMFASEQCINLLFSVKSLLKMYQDRVVLLVTMSIDPISSYLRTQIELLMDGIITLDPFPQEMLQFLEKIYKGQPNKVQQGLVHITKLPIVSDRGEMNQIKSEFAFRNSKKSFNIEEWSIPVEDEDTDAKDHTTPEESQKQTTTSLDF